ncbi:MAG: hypothetical protein ACJ79H_03545 [Myxococcales bacterium]
MAEQLVRELEALRVGPDEVLVVHLGQEFSELVGDVVDDLVRVGLEDRSVVFIGEVRFAVVKKDDAP